MLLPPGPRRILALAAALAAAGACQFGGPTRAPGTLAPGEARDSGGDGDPSREAAADAPVAIDADDERDGGGGDDGRPAGDAAGDGAAPPANGASCVPPFASQGCDPVCNVGCPALSRCDLGPEPAQGVCIGIWIGAEGSLCVRTPSTDPCSPRLSCLEGRCRRLCYVDGDCVGAGTGCCNMPVQIAGRASGYRSCGPCDP